MSRDDGRSVLRLALRMVGRERRQREYEKLAREASDATGYGEGDLMMCIARLQLQPERDVRALLFLVADWADYTGTAVDESAKVITRLFLSPELGAFRIELRLVPFNPADWRAIQALARAGGVEAARAMLLECLQASIGGFAREYGSTTAGAVMRLRNRVHEAAVAVAQDLRAWLNLPVSRK